MTMTGCDLTTRARLYARDQRHIVDAPLIDKLADEVDRLLRELAEVQAAWYGRCVVIDERDAQIGRLRAALEVCREHVRTHHNASGGWWNDRDVYRLIRKHIDPALSVETPSRTDEQSAEREGK